MAKNRKNRSPKHNNCAPRGEANHRYQGGQWEHNVNLFEHNKTIANLVDEENQVHSKVPKKKIKKEK